VRRPRRVALTARTDGSIAQICTYIGNEAHDPTEYKGVPKACNPGLAATLCASPPPPPLKRSPLTRPPQAECEATAALWESSPYCASPRRRCGRRRRPRSRPAALTRVRNRHRLLHGPRTRSAVRDGWNQRPHRPSTRATRRRLRSSAACLRPSGSVRRCRPRAQRCGSPSLPFLKTGEGCDTPCATYAKANNLNVKTYCQSKNQPVTYQDGGCKLMNSVRPRDALC